MKKLLTALLTTALLLLCLLPFSALAATDDGAAYAADQIIVKYKDGLPPVSPFFSSRTTLDAENGIQLVTVAEGAVEKSIATFEADPRVEWAQPNYAYSLMAESNDPLAYRQWYLDSVSLKEAWDYAGANDVLVAVLDDGANISHPDLADNIAYTRDVITGGAVTDSASQHGTHVAGTISAVTNNGTGVAGVAANAGLVIVNVFRNDGLAYSSDILKGIDYAMSKGARVINISFGSISQTGVPGGYDALVVEALEDAFQNGTVVVAASGNINSEADKAKRVFPADFGNTVSVIPLDQNDERLSTAGHNAYKKLSAPGKSILSTYGTTYVSMTGSSMSAPVVSGICALLFSADPELTAQEAVTALYSTATDLGGSGRDDYFGYGKVNALAAIKSIYNGPRITQQPEGVDLPSGSDFSLSVRASYGTALSYQWYRDGEPISGEASATLKFKDAPRETSGAYSVLVSGADGSSTMSDEATVLVRNDDCTLARAIVRRGSTYYVDEAYPERDIYGEVLTTSYKVYVGGTPADPNAHVGAQGTYTLAPGVTDVKLTVRSEYGTKRTYTLHLHRAPSTNNYLSELSVTVDKQEYLTDFEQKTFAYSVYIPNTTRKFTLNGAAVSPGATVTGNGTYAVTGSSKTVPLIVMSELGTKRTYRVTVIKAASPVIEGVALAPSYRYGFTPGGGNMQKITTVVTSEAPAVATATILNAAGKSVAELSADVADGKAMFYWDGKATAGNEAGIRAGRYVPRSDDGTYYRIAISVFSACGEAPVRLTSPIYVYTVPDELKVSATKRVISYSSGTRFNLSADRTTNILLQVTTKSGAVVWEAAYTNVPSGTQRQTVLFKGIDKNGKKLPAGKYYVKVSAAGVIVRPSWYITLKV